MLMRNQSRKRYRYSQPTPRHNFLLRILWHPMVAGFLLLAITTTEASAQAIRKIDSLVDKLEQPIHDSLKIEYNWEVGNDYWLYHEDSLDLAKYYTKTSIELAEQQKRSDWTVHGYNLLGKIFNLMQQLDSALWSFDQGMKACLAREDSMRYMMLYDNKANIFVDKGMYAEALKMKQEASDFFRHHADSNTVSSSYFGLGYIYLMKGDNAPAKNYFYQSLSFANNWPLIESEIYGNLAMIYTDLKNPDSAEICFHQSAILSKEIPSIYSLNLYEYALFKDEQGEQDSALFYLEQVLGAEGQGMELEQYNLMQLDYARILAEKGYSLQARNYYDAAGSSIRTSQNPRHLRKLFLTEAAVFEQLGNHRRALLAYKRYQQLQDSIESAESEARFKEIEVAYETEKKEQEIQVLNAENEISALRLASSQRLILGLGAGLASLAVLAFFLYRQRQKIKQQRDQINVALTEKEILLREIHHRVKNNLQFISSLLGLQTEHVSDQAALGALQEGQDRVQSMALIHQDLYQEDNLTGVDMKKYFTKLVRGLFDSYNIRKDQIQLEMDIEDLNLDVDSVIPIGLIVNELVSNCLKYAFPVGRNGTIVVSLNEEEDQLALRVRDDGIGMSEVNRTDLGSSFGYRLIEVLREQMQGNLQIENNQGTSITLYIKKYQKNALASSY